jgi:hypothetical protein
MNPTANIARPSGTGKVPAFQQEMCMKIRARETGVSINRRWTQMNADVSGFDGRYWRGITKSTK